jgi:hypothetical protein
MRLKSGRKEIKILAKSSIITGQSGALLISRLQNGTILYAAGFVICQ